MIIGLGIDLAPIGAFEDEARRERFAARCFTMGEREYAASRGVAAAQSAAGMFAAKESALKAFSAGIGDMPLTDIEVLHAPSGAPSLALHGEAARRAGALNVSRALLSITHQGDYAAAVVILEG
ncbi:MAG: holo-ACP synthase [Oscillospiraceae bacterium]|jgi:holo-[acyl-carrier protein] synthase|nr:holo-ACP synthase [Oscillospiraceae bacterium]